MREKLRIQISAWHESDNHKKIIEAIEELPAHEYDPEAIGLLARAYNNIAEYQTAVDLLDSISETSEDSFNWHFRMGYALYFLDRDEEAMYHFKRANELMPDDEDTLEFIRRCNEEIPFRDRVRRFWQWFEDNEERLSDMVQNSDESDPDEKVNFIAEGLDILADDVHFNIGGDHEFTLSVEGDFALFYLYPYIAEQMPDRVKEKWNFFPFNPGVKEPFTFDMYGAKVNMDEVYLGVTYQEEDNAFDIAFYNDGLASLSEAESSNAFYIMMEIMLGEGLSALYIRDVNRSNTKRNDMITLPELRAYIENTLRSMDKEVFENPKEVNKVYSLEPSESEELRFDVFTGSTCFEGLVAQYYQGNTSIYDRINGFGARAAFIAFPHDCESDEELKEVLNIRYQLEDRIDEELFRPEGLGIMLGGALGSDSCYIDLIVYDLPEFVKKVYPILQDYPQISFYLSEFRQGVQLTKLSDIDQ